MTGLGSYLPMRSVRALTFEQCSLKPERLQNDVDDSHVSKYERNRSEPTLKVLLAYALIADVQLAQLVDDDVDLTLDL